MSVPVTAENRGYLRLLRQLELEAWVDARGAQDPPEASPARSLRQQLVQLRGDNRNESRLYAALAVLAFGSLGYGLFQCWQLAEHWSVVTRLVQRLLA